MRRILFLLLIGLAGTATLIWLGVWQMQRLAWKEAMLARIEAEISAAPVPLPPAPTPETAGFLPVTASGEILEPEIRVLASKKQIGPGYRIIAPFRVGDRTILLDRGFLEIADEDTARSTGPAEITGNLHWPDEVDGFTPEPDRDAGLWFARDVPSLAQALEFVNSKEIQNKLTAEKGYAQQLVENKKPFAENVADIFLRIYARPPRAAELKIAVEFLEAEKDPAEAYRSLLWSLLATNEFLFNH